jgi:hypothetical protein
VDRLRRFRTVDRLRRFRTLDRLRRFPTVDRLRRFRTVDHRRKLRAGNCRRMLWTGNFSQKSGLGTVAGTSGLGTVAGSSGLWRHTGGLMQGPVQVGKCGALAQDALGCEGALETRCVKPHNMVPERRHTRGQMRETCAHDNGLVSCSLCSPLNARNLASSSSLDSLTGSGSTLSYTNHSVCPHPNKIGGLPLVLASCPRILISSPFLSQK